MPANQTLSCVYAQYAFSALSIVLLAVLQWLIALWLKSRLESSIKHEYDKKLSEFQYELRIREQAAKIAEFFSEWARGDQADKTKLRLISMELSLWLPSETYKKLGKCVTYSKDAPSSNDILIDIRKHLLKNLAGDLNASEIVLF